MKDDRKERQRTVKRELREAQGVAREAALQHIRQRRSFEWYFLRRFDEIETTERGAEFEVQKLDSNGRARAVLRFSFPAPVPEFAGRPVPEAVVDQLRNLSAGAGDFFDAMGRRINPTTLDPIGG
jgi:hypothetical protein